MPEHPADTKAKTGAADAAPEADVTFTPSPKLEEDVTRERRLGARTCPQCGGATKPYEGTNPHKQGSYECPRCRLRVHPA